MRCTIVEQMRPERPGESDAMLAAPRMYRPVSALADHTEIIGHWHAHVGYRSSQGFNSSAPTVWTIEGLLQYIEAPDVDRLFARVDALSAPGSVLLYDVVGKTLLEAPFLQTTIELMQKLGAPWVFGSDTPGALVEGRGWSATVTDMAVPGNAWKRWEHPAIPAEVPNAPRGYFVEAMKA
jgi:O-methyltransferase involved in polyketide biosynthesis